MYKVMGFYTQNTKKVLYVFEELGLDYEFQFVDLMKGENKTEEFLIINPVGKVPVLQHDGENLFESGAICRYVANQENSSLYPENKMQRAHVDQWMDFFSCHLGKWMNTLYFEKHLKAKAGLGAPDVSVCQEASKFAMQQVGVVDKWLKRTGFFVEDHLTIADIFAFAYVEQAVDCGISLSDYPNVAGWMEKIQGRDSVKRALEKLNR